MKLQEIFAQLGSGELSNLSIGGQPQGVVNQHNYSQLIGHINLGLMTIFRRFQLKEGSIIIQLQPNTLKYYLNSSFAVSNRRSHEPVRYILDSADQPFKDDILKVSKVVLDTGYEMGLNDDNDPRGAHTPTMLTLEVPDELLNPTSDTPKWFKSANIKVSYQGKHPMILAPIGYFDPNQVNVDLPDSHLQALLYFVASRVNNPVGMTNEFNAGNNWYAKYENECKHLESEGMQVDQINQHQYDRIRQKGFV